MFVVVISWIMGFAFACFLIAAILYFLAPGVLFNGVMALSRRSSGLRLKSTTVDGHEIPYLEGGRGPVLVLLHGFAANKDHWTMIGRFLTPHFRVIAPDVPGFGDSSRLPNARYDLDRQIERLAKFADSLGLERFHLGGNSMGGYLAAVFAARHDEKVESLWLLAPAGVMTAEPASVQIALERGENPLLITDLAAFDELTALCFSSVPPIPAQFKRYLVQRAIAEAPFNEKIFDEMFAEPLGLETALEGCETRTLLVWGDEDRILHPSGATVLEQMLPQCDMRVMQRMGHIPMVERPAETASDLLNFHQRSA